MKTKPIKCSYPKCAECPYVDCRYDNITTSEMLRQNKVDKQLEANTCNRHYRYRHTEHGKAKIHEINMREHVKAAKKEYAESEHGATMRTVYKDSHKEYYSAYNKALYREKHPVVKADVVKKKQDKIYRYIKTYMLKNGFPPTTKEILDHSDYGTIGVINKVLNILEKQGKIGYNHGRLYLIGYKLVKIEEKED